MAKKSIVIHDLWKSYGKLAVLQGITLDIYEGETLVILGRSGVGKSVLLKQIIGLESPDSGYVEIDGIRITPEIIEKPPSALKTMGMLFQGAALFDSMSVGENTAFYLKQHDQNRASAEVDEEVNRALEMVGLLDAKHKMPSECSGGMKKRAALARLAAYHPDIILYDEPTTGLDPITAMQINELILQTQEKLQATSIVVTHDITSAMKVGDRLAFHHDGRIIHIAPKNQFLETENPLITSFFQNAIVDDSMISRKRSP